MAEYSVPAFAEFIDAMRAHFAKGLPETEQWESVGGLLKTLCGDEEMRAASRGWEAKVGREYILHHDPDFDFFVGALVREPNHRAGVHDHGPTWTVYGVLDGDEITHLYERLDDQSDPSHAELKLVDKYDAPTGHVDIVRPHIPHAEWGNGDRSVAITVRTTKPGGYDQIRFDLETGKTSTSRGLELIPMPV